MGEWDGMGWDEYWSCGYISALGGGLDGGGLLRFRRSYDWDKGSGPRKRMKLLVQSVI